MREEEFLRYIESPRCQVNNKIILLIFNEVGCQIQNIAKNVEVVIVNYFLLDTGRYAKFNQDTAHRGEITICFIVTKNPNRLMAMSRNYRTPFTASWASPLFSGLDLAIELG